MYSVFLLGTSSETLRMMNTYRRTRPLQVFRLSVPPRAVRGIVGKRATYRRLLCSIAQGGHVGIIKSARSVNSRRFFSMSNKF